VGKDDDLEKRKAMKVTFSGGCKKERPVVTEERAQGRPAWSSSLDWLRNLHPIRLMNEPRSLLWPPKAPPEIDKGDFAQFHNRQVISIMASNRRSWHSASNGQGIMPTPRMKTSHSPRLKAWFLAGCSLALAGQNAVRAAEGSDGITAVASRTSGDYIRAKRPDGTFQPEYYSFGKGGNWGGEIKDATIDRLGFIEVARIIAAPLASQDYLPARDPKTTKLLVMVYWGTTAVPESAENSVAYSNFSEAESALRQAMNPMLPEPPAAQNAAMAQWSAAMTMVNFVNQQRTHTDWKNAAMLGYDSAGVIGTEYGNHVRGSALGGYRDDLVAEIEENRYFVVLMAYDFQLLWKQKKHKLLWETRFSIRERNHQFDRDLPSMARYAAQYFGQDSHGLVRKEVPLGQVEIGAIKSLGEVDEPKK
jgi:hypothetical protein